MTPPVKKFLLALALAVPAFAFDGGGGALGGGESTGAGGDTFPGSTDTETPIFYRPEPYVLTVASFAPNAIAATISDVKTADFDNDGRMDIAVAWYVTYGYDPASMTLNQRRLTIYYGNGTPNPDRGADYNLYVPNFSVESLSIFRNGTSAIAIGDFDGDGDSDIAATVFFGDEIWFLENRGDRLFNQYTKYPFGYNGTGNFQTPTEAIAADFNGDGRDDLVYVADPVLYIQNRVLHFWRTTSTIAAISRVNWEGTGGQFVQWTRGLEVADFDQDGKPDVCYSGATDSPAETAPLLTFLTDFNASTGKFVLSSFVPGEIVSDIVAFSMKPGCPVSLALPNAHGTDLETWKARCNGQIMQYVFNGLHDGFAGVSPDRGCSVVAGDIDGDGDCDLVTKQKSGSISDANQIELAVHSNLAQHMFRVEPTPLDSTGLENDGSNQILRPRNLALVDLFGNTLPEIVAGFGYQAGSGGDSLKLAIWANSCLGDADRDGRSSSADVDAILMGFGWCAGDGFFYPDTDLDKSGCTDVADLLIATEDAGCGD